MLSYRLQNSWKQDTAHLLTYTKVVSFHCQVGTKKNHLRIEPQLSGSNCPVDIYTGYYLGY